MKNNGDMEWQKRSKSESENIKVSVLVAAYNVEKYIMKCLQSILEQTHKNIEIIVVDDCSHDSTAEICGSFEKKDSRVKVIHHTKNQRLPGVRNTGLDNATGDYIMFVDGDDWLAEDCVEYLLTLALNNKTDMAISKECFTTRDYRQVETDAVEIWDAEEATANFLFSRINIGAWNKIYKRDFIEKNHLRFKSLFTAEGFTFISDCSQRTDKIAVGKRKIYYYRLNNANSATTLPDIRQGLGALEALERIEKNLIIRTPKTMASIQNHRYQNMVWTLRIILETKQRDKYPQIYKECIQYIRKNGSQVARNNRRYFGDKGIRIMIKSMFPVVFAKYDIWKKNKAFDKDVRENARRDDNMDSAVD